MDTNGSLIQKIFKGKVHLDIVYFYQIQAENIADGVYFIRILADTEMTFVKFVVVN